MSKEPSAKPQEVLINVWRQTLVEGAKYVQIADEKYPVRETARRRLKQVDFRFEDHELRGLEQNRDTSRDGQNWLEKERK